MSIKVNNESFLLNKIKDYFILFKLRLSLFVVFSACTAFIISSYDVNIHRLLVLSLGGFLITASSNTFNQVLEVETDKLMTRTQNRPLPAGRMLVSEAVLVAGLTGLVGLILLSLLSTMTAVLGAISLVSYSFIYTPMKKISPAAVWIGAIPGALPMAIGSVAANDDGLGSLAIFLFSVQFLWQFPHFWAIAWLAYNDYAKANFYLLPSSNRDGRTKSTVLQIIFYTLCLISLSYVPFFVFDICGLYSCTIMLLMGLIVLFFGVKLYFSCNNQSAKMLMFSTLFYQLVVYIALIIDKI